MWRGRKGRARCLEGFRALFRNWMSLPQSAKGAHRAGPLENHSGHDVETGLKGTSTKYQQNESSSILRKLYIMTKWDLSQKRKGVT